MSRTKHERPCKRGAPRWVLLQADRRNLKRFRRYQDDARRLRDRDAVASEVEDHNAAIEAANWAWFEHCNYALSEDEERALRVKVQEEARRLGCW